MISRVATGGGRSGPAPASDPGVRPVLSDARVRANDAEREPNMPRVNTAARSGLAIVLDLDALTFDFGSEMHAVPPEFRTLEAVRESLMEPEAGGPDPLYAIYMDFCFERDRERIIAGGLLYGGVLYNHGSLGRELLRSQGHRHSANEHGVRYPEVYEFWHGRGILYAQEADGRDVSACYAMKVSAGDVVIVPPGWVHLTINAGNEPLAFGAWCARRQGFDYEAIRRMRGPAWYYLDDGSRVRNPHYASAAEPAEPTPRDYPEFDLVQGKPIYEQYLERPERLRFLTHPHEHMEAWKSVEARP
jgi:glucose-6-phosphate isomerase